MTITWRLPQAARMVARRLLKALPLLLAVVVFNFILLKLAPGDAAEVLAGESGASTPEYLAELRARFGLDRPVYIQLGNYVWKLAQLDLGYSFRHNQSVLQLILGRLPATLLLMASGLLVAVTLGGWLGVMASRKVNSLRDNLISLFAMLAFATPVFWTVDGFSPNVRLAMYLNPLTGFIEIIRDLTVGGAVPRLPVILWSLFQSVTTFYFGFWFFRRQRDRIADVI